MTETIDPAIQQAANLFRAGNLSAAADVCLRILASGEQDVALGLLGVIRLNQNDLAAAADCYRRLTVIAPDSHEAHENLGLVLTWQKIYPAALASLQKALALRPERAEVHNNIGNVHLAAGRTEAAIASFRKAATISPRFVAAHFNLGLALSQAHRTEEAIACYRAAIASDSAFAPAYNNLGLCLRSSKREEEAAAVLQKAVELQPGLAEAHNNLGNALVAIGRHEEAASSFRRAAELAPELPEPHFNLGNAMAGQKQFAAAALHYERAIALKAGYIEALINLGNCYSELRRYEAALDAFRRALLEKPDSFEAHLNAGIALHMLRRDEEAVSSFNLAVGLRPADPEAQNGLGNTLVSLNRYPEAMASFEQALAGNPEHANALGVASFLRRQMCAWQDLQKHESVLLDHVREGTVNIAPFMFLAITEDPELQLACAKTYWSSLKVPTAPYVATGRGSHDKLSIGYVSGNFRAHATSFLTAQLYELHDRTHFDVTGFSYGPDEEGPMRQRIKAGFDRFIDLNRANDDQMFAAIREQRVDILIDLKGYQQNTRIDVLARRPAPVQVHYICHPGTLGVDFIDYAFVDRYLVPPEAEPFFSEKLVFLPDSYLVTDQKRVVAAPPGRAACGLPESGFVFCCFNNTYKITPSIFDVWMRLLKAVPGSVLWLIADNRWAEDNLRREAQNRGVDPARLVFAPRLRLPEHLARHRHADLFIDTFPYCAHTTATDALWAGLPLLTLPGRSFASRVAASLLRASNLPELIVQSVEDYEALALKLATDPALLARIKAKLAGDLTLLPAFDTPRIVRHIETAYERMWQRYEAGEPPQSFAV